MQLESDIAGGRSGRAEEESPVVAVDPNLQLLQRLCSTYPRDVPVARQLYVDLKTVKLWDALAVCELPQLGLCYLTGQVKKGVSPKETILPLRAHDVISPAGLVELFQTLENGSLRDFIFGIVDSDSSISYYRVYNAVVPPTELKAMPPQLNEK